MNSARPTRKSTRRRGPALGRNFHRFWTGSLSSNLADGLMLTALPMLAATLTNDPFLVSLIAVARFLPWLLFGLLAGAVVDRVDRVRLMVGANLARALVVAGLAVVVATGNASIWTIVLAMFLAMCFEVLYDLAGRAMLPDIAPAGTLERANGRLVGGRTVTEDFGGAPLAGFLFVIAAALPLAVNAGAYLLGALVLLGLPLAVRRPGSPDGEAAGVGRSGGGARTSLFDEIREGLRYTFGDASIRAMVLFGAATNIGLMAMNAVMVLLVTDHFGVPLSLFGAFMASLAAGALVGAILAGWLVARLGRFPLQVGGFVLQGTLCALVAVAPNVSIAVVAWTVLGAVMAVSNTVLLGVVQRVVPGAMLGRMMSCSQFLGFGLTPVGSVLGGLLGRVDLRIPSLFAAGVVLLCLVLVLPALRRLAHRADAIEREADECERRKDASERKSAEGGRAGV
ncbi:MFS transporter [Nocardiopsis sp. MG754419]|nr:MFS transporter [Nocardiopsis sp. MG754419]